MVRPWLKLSRSVSWRHGTAVSFFMFCWTCFYMPLMLCSGLTRFPKDHRPLSGSELSIHFRQEPLCWCNCFFRAAYKACTLLFYSRVFLVLFSLCSSKVPRFLTRTGCRGGERVESVWGKNSYEGKDKKGEGAFPELPFPLCSLIFKFTPESVGQTSGAAQILCGAALHKSQGQSESAARR